MMKDKFKNVVNLLNVTETDLEKMSANVYLDILVNPHFAGHNA